MLNAKILKNFILGQGPKGLHLARAKAAAKVAALQLVFLIIFRSLSVCECVTPNVGPLLNVGKLFKMVDFSERIKRESEKKDVK